MKSIKGLLIAVTVVASFLGCLLIGVDRSSDRLTVNMLYNLEMRFRNYKEDVGEYPSTDSALNALHKCPSDVDPRSWKGPYIPMGMVPEDFFDQSRRPIHYRKISPDQYLVWSMGRDGESDTDDDIWLEVSGSGQRLRRGRYAQEAAAP